MNIIVRSLLLVTLLLLGQGAFTQREAMHRASNSLVRTPLTTTDTIVAIQKVFQSRRQGGAILIGGTAALIAAVTVGTALEEKSFLGPEGAALLFAIGTSPAWIIGIIKRIRFSARREQMVLAKYQSTHKIPPFLRKRIGLSD